MLVFFDDILIFNKTWEDHLRPTNEVLGKLEQHSFYAKASKCEFGLIEILYFGFNISTQGVSIDKKKIKANQDSHRPKNLSHLRGFVGLCNYYQRFLKGF